MSNRTNASGALLWTTATCALMLAGIGSSVANADGVASSADYSFDYAIVGAGAADTTSSDDAYGIIGFVATEGVAGGIASSADYETRPMVGVDITEVPVTVSAFSIE